MSDVPVPKLSAQAHSKRCSSMWWPSIATPSSGSPQQLPPTPRPFPSPITWCLSTMQLDWNVLIPLLGPPAAAIARYDSVLAPIPNPAVLLFAVDIAGSGAVVRRRKHARDDG
jgi:hypothetical protein